MRVTNQMLAKTAIKSGIPLQQNSLLNIMTQQNQSDDNSLISKLGKTKDEISAWQKINSQKNKANKKLEEHASSLSEFATKLNASGEGSLFAKAQESNSTEDIIKNVQGMVESYNNTLDQLKDSDGGLNEFYMEELQNYVKDHTDVLKAAGVTAGSDGKLSIDEEALKKADLETLEKAFGNSSGFTDKLGFVAGRVAENASTSAAESAFLNQYNESGLSNWESYIPNHYNYWG